MNTIFALCGLFFLLGLLVGAVVGEGRRQDRYEPTEHGGHPL